MYRPKGKRHGVAKEESFDHYKSMKGEILKTRKLSTDIK